MQTAVPSTFTSFSPGFDRATVCNIPSAMRCDRTVSGPLWLLIDTNSRTRFFIYAITLHRKRVQPLGPPPIAWRYKYQPRIAGVPGSVLSLLIRDRGGWRLSERAERQLQHLPAATAATAVVVRPSRRRVLKALVAALPLQALHLAYEAGHLRRMTCLLGPADANLGWWSHRRQV